MYKTKGPDGRLNICGMNIARLRTAMVPKCSQRDFADKLQLFGINITKNAIQCIESGNRFVTDIELKAIAKALEVPVEELLKEE